MKKLTQEEVKLQILNGIINPTYTNNGARTLRANEIRSYEIQPNKIFGIFVAEEMEDGFVKEKLFDFDLTRKKEGSDWQLTYEYHVAKNAALLYFPDMQTHHYYREGNTTLTESGVLTRPALLLTEGDVTDSNGQKTTYTRELIDSIVATSNEYALTQEIKLFTHHEYSQKARIGSVTGKFTAREIDATDLPENADRESIGKYAIFNDGIEIRDKKAIEKYHSKLLKELSIGIILSGNTGTIFEVSAVPWGAVKEAHIYSGISQLKDCEKGKPCGNTCIALDKECDPTTRFPKLTREGKGGPVTQETKIGDNTVKTKISRDPTQDFDPPPWVRKIDIYVNGGFEKTSIEGKEGLKLALASKEHVREYVRNAPEGSILSNTPFRDDGFGDQRVKLYEKAGFSSPNADGVMFSIVSNQKNVPITLDEIKELKALNHIKEAG